MGHSVTKPAGVELQAFDVASTCLSSTKASDLQMSSDILLQVGTGNDKSFKQKVCCFTIIMNLW